jgi:hypothetical protein
MFIVPAILARRRSPTDSVRQIGELCRLLDVRLVGDGRSVDRESSFIRLDLSGSRERSGNTPSLLCSMLRTAR